jgi:hypothetical protein
MRSPAAFVELAFAFAKLSCEKLGFPLQNKKHRCAEPFILERETRLELATFSLGRRRSSQLSYTRIRLSL